MQTPEAAGLTRSVGLPASYGTTDFLPLEVFNQLWREITGAAMELGEHGLLPWHTGQSYPHDPISLVIGSDGELYKSVQASGGSLTSQDPTTDTQRHLLGGVRDQRSRTAAPRRAASSARRPLLRRGPGRPPRPR